MRDPEAPLDDMLEYAGRAMAYVAGLTFEDFAGDMQVQDAVIRCLFVIGEASRRVADSVRQRYPSVAWSDIAGMRNVLAHDYDGVDLELVWDTTTRYVPDLLRALGERP